MSTPASETKNQIFIGVHDKEFEGPGLYVRGCLLLIDLHQRQMAADIRQTFTDLLRVCFVLLRLIFYLFGLIKKKR